MADIKLQLLNLGLKGRSSSQRNDYEVALAVAVKHGHKVLALAPSAASLSPVTRSMCGRVLDWPPLTGQMVFEVLRVTHTATGELAEDALIELLPSDADIAALPLAVIEGAFCEVTTLQVAKALAITSTRLRASPPVTKSLNHIILNANTRDPVNRLVANIAAWKTGQLGGSEVSSSVLFHGPPGNGKTLLASAIAESLQVPLIATSYSDCQRQGHQGDMLEFRGVMTETLSEGMLSELQIGMKGTMNALFIKDLGFKTRRGMMGRALAGKCAGGRAYGYKNLVKYSEAGDPIKGDRAIISAEAATINRIFTDYANGISSKKIAETLNNEGIPGPSGRGWGASTLHAGSSHAMRHFLIVTPSQYLRFF